MYSRDSLTFLNGRRCYAVYFSTYMVTVASSTLILGIFTREPCVTVREGVLLWGCEAAKPHKNATGRSSEQWSWCLPPRPVPDTLANDSASLNHRVSLQLSCWNLSNHRVKNHMLHYALPEPLTHRACECNVMGHFKPLSCRVIWNTIKVRGKSVK